VAIVLGSLLVGFGIWADVGALLIAGFLIGITPVMHAFWKETEPQQQQLQLAMFTKNVALLGAALIVFWIYNQLQGEAPVSITDPLFGRAD
jgi:putative oxidoreductase